MNQGNIAADRLPSIDVLQGLAPQHALLILAGVLFLLALAALLLGPRRYVRQPALFSAAERACLDALERAVDGRWRISGKVRLADVITPSGKSGGRGWWRAFTKVSSKHLDFVLTDWDSGAIALGIELDDRSHAEKRRRARDRFVDRALAQAGVPLLRVRAQRRYDAAALRQSLDKLLGAAAVQAPPAPARRRRLRRAGSAAAS